MKNKIGLAIMLAIFTVIAFSYSAFAASTNDITGTVKYTDTGKSTLQDVGVSAIEAIEAGNDGFTGSGTIVVKIPANVKLYNFKSASSPDGNDIARTEAALGSSSSKKKIYVRKSLSAGGTSHGLFVRHGASDYGIMYVYTSGDTAVYGTGDISSATFKDYAYLGDISAGFKKIDLSLGTVGAGASSTQPVGTIYYDTTTDETVMELGVKKVGDTVSEKLLVGSGMKLKPATANTTGDVKLSLSNGTSAPVGITEGSYKVLVLTNQPASLSGTAAGSSVPSIKAGAVSPQQMGVAKLTFVGDGDVETDSTLIFTLNNGATFHTDADTPGAKVTNTISVADADIAVNSSGQAVVTVEDPDPYVSDGDTFVWTATSPFIDASGVTNAGPITLTVTGTNYFAGLNQSITVAEAKIAGVDITFKDDTTAGVPTLFAGRKDQKLGTNEYILVGETSPASLLGGGSVKMELNMGAKFQTSNAVGLIADYATSPYGSGFEMNDISSKTASASKTATVKTASSSNRGAFTIAKGTTNKWLDLSSVTTKGDLTMTFSGNAGASGVVTMGNVIYPTATTSLSIPNVAPGNSFTLPDIQVVENKAGALVAGFFGIKFPASFTPETTVSPTVTATDGTGTSSTTAVVFDNWEAATKTAFFEVKSGSNSTAGAYTVVISGLQGAFASTATTSDTKFTIAGSKTDEYESKEFGGNFGAKPFTESVQFCQIVSATLPFLGTADVSGTAITQTMIAAGNDQGKVGDIYVFTASQWWNGSAWSSTEAAYETGKVLGTHTINYDVNGLANGTNVFIGYGVGVNDTSNQMNNNGTFVLAYTVTTTPTTPTTVVSGKNPGSDTATVTPTDTLEAWLNITNDDGVTPTYEWLVFGALLNGTDVGVFFFTTAGDIVAYETGLDLTTVTYDYSGVTGDSFNVTNLVLGDLGLAAGDTFWYGYVYGTDTFDITDDTTWSLENFVNVTIE